MGATRIIRKLTNEEYSALVHGRPMAINPHALFRLASGQRKLFKESDLLDLLSYGRPLLVGVQHNERYSAFFPHGKGYIRIIFQINFNNHLEIGTFHITYRLPHLDYETN
ncbi:MAG TPA: hypothetical protein VJH22_02100 [Candidatus Nanoarchaeia archaeon]|nr:hypothetical protein [Candidatus Nanoarchaeia archaeon]